MQVFILLVLAKFSRKRLDETLKICYSIRPSLQRAFLFAMRAKTII